jgi:hypothetical protein
MNIEMGKTYKDKITGFTGICTGKCDYISGCSQALRQPKKKEDGTGPDGCWFDFQRLDEMPGEKIVLENEKTPGCDMQAPIR